MKRTRVALVTGAASGIGAAIAFRLATDGVHVYCADRNIDGADQVVSSIRSLGGGADSLHLDVADDAMVEDVAAELRLQIGALDVLVNNAGIGSEVPIRELTMLEVRRVLAVNLEGSIAVTLALLPLILGSSTARILNITSVQGFLGAKDSLAYGTSKGGLENFTRDLACELADDGVLVNALAPGFIDTPLAVRPDGTHEYDDPRFLENYVKGGRIPLRRPASAQEVAETAAFFCSTANTYVTGQILAVDGGLSATF